MFLIAGLGNPDKKYEKQDIILDLIPSMHWRKIQHQHHGEKT